MITEYQKILWRLKKLTPIELDSLQNLIRTMLQDLELEALDQKKVYK